jgi:N-acetylglucosaminyltransferase
MMIPIELIAYLVFALPSCVVLFRFAMMIYPEQALPVFMQVKRDINRTPTVAVIIPTYNEGQPVYEAIKSVALSKYPKDKLSIYPQDDGSKDDSYGWIMKASYDFPNVFPQENGENLGKTLTYIKGLDRSESDIVLIIDSDTTVAPEAINKIMANFADPRIGVVGAVCGTANPNHNILTAIQTQLYFFGQRLAKVAESHFQGVAVIGGYALAVRRQVLLELKPHILNRNWFGVIVKDGEDRFITHLALLRGWNTYVEQRAEIRTFAMDTYPKYFGQQLRWKRSLIRTFLWVMRTLPKQVKTINLAALFALCASAFTALVLFMMFLFIVFVNPSAIFEPMRLVHLVFITALVYTACLNVKQIKDQLVNNPFKMIMFLAWWIVNIFYLVLLSLFTLDQDAWGNREIKIKPIEEEV